MYDDEKDYYFKITVTGKSSYTTSSNADYAFKVVFEDACRTATIIPQTITFPDLTWLLDTSYTEIVPAFGDDVDGATNLAGTGTYAAGICGEKEVTFDAGTPAFLTLTPDATDPILNAFTIYYDESLATESDIMIHTISYTVASKEYGGEMTSLTGTF